MKYKDYYQVLGVERDADTDAIKKAYRKLAHKYHPDVSKDPAGEEKFKEIADAYQTLKDPEKRAAYDQLGRHQPGQDFQPPPDWGKQFGDTQFSFDDVDLADLFAGLAGGGAAGGAAGWRFSHGRTGLRGYRAHHVWRRPFAAPRWIWISPCRNTTSTAGCIGCRDRSRRASPKAPRTGKGCACAARAARARAAGPTAICI